MHYVIQENVFNEVGFDRLVRAIERMGLPHDIISLYPFTDKITIAGIDGAAYVPKKMFRVRRGEACQDIKQR